MKRVVLAVPNPWDYLDQFPDHSIAVINPDSGAERRQYLLNNLNYSVLVTPEGIQYEDGGDYNEKLVLYTSGTTGDSKFYSYTESQVQHVIDRIVVDYELTANDRYLSIMPLWHAHGMLMTLAARHVKAEIRTVKVTDLKSQLDFSPTYISAIPDLLKLMARNQQFPDLRFVRSASVALPTQTYRDLRDHFGVPVVESFGMTETVSHCFTNPLHGEQHVGTVGLPSGINAEILDGHLWLQGSQCYTSEWFDTGDLADQNSAGYYRILGRAVDRLNVHGIKLDPLSIENKLYNRVPGLGEVAVFGDDRVMCVYTGDVDPQTVRAELTKIDPHCTPRLLQQVASIPKNAAGKVSRALLKETYN